LQPKDDILTQFQDSATQLKLSDSILLLRLFPPQEEECRLTVWCMPDQFSASAIARAVEDCDAHLINLNVTSDRTPDGELVVELRINHRHGESVARSLERYGYTVASIGNDRADDDSMTAVAKERIGELLHYLDI
jgi:hypothetical protein